MQLEVAGEHDLARRLVLDELFDLSLYTALGDRASEGLRETLASLIQVERKHLDFWQELFGIRPTGLDWARWLKLRLILILCSVLGEAAVHLVLEAIEVYGVRKYLSLWEQYRDHPLGRAVHQVLEDEFKHEDLLVSQLAERKISPERIRNLFLGFNDGVIEMLGAVSGFFAALQSAPLILAAGVSVAAAGAISMAAGAFAATSSESEITDVERRKRAFLGEIGLHDERAARPGNAAALVGASYIIGALVPILPVALGAATPIPSVIAAGAMVVLLSVVLSFLSGMSVRRRLGLNLGIVALSGVLSYAVGTLARTLWGVSV
ncbi:MAG: hypothetical protein GEU73_08885 [Chloroflexi bacterium]|nr:hypothetical protein [Chloroflexota bacterium]